MHAQLGDDVTQAVIDTFLASPPIQDFIVLGGLRSPGRATVAGAGSPRDWDIRKGWAFSTQLEPVVE